MLSERIIIAALVAGAFKAVAFILAEFLFLFFHHFAACRADSALQFFWFFSGVFVGFDLGLKVDDLPARFVTVAGAIRLVLQLLFQDLGFFRGAAAGSFTLFALLDLLLTAFFCLLFFSCSAR